MLCWFDLVPAEPSCSLYSLVTSLNLSSQESQNDKELKKIVCDGQRGNSDFNVTPLQQAGMKK